MKIVEREGDEFDPEIEHQKRSVEDLYLDVYSLEVRKQDRERRETAVQKEGLEQRKML